MVREPQLAATVVISWDDRLLPLIARSDSQLHRFHDLLRSFDQRPREVRLPFVQIVRAFEEAQHVIDYSNNYIAIACGVLANATRLRSNSFWLSYIQKLEAHLWWGDV
jgi:hypothetical protein